MPLCWLFFVCCPLPAPQLLHPCCSLRKDYHHQKATLHSHHGLEGLEWPLWGSLLPIVGVERDSVSGDTNEFSPCTDLFQTVRGILINGCFVSVAAFAGSHKAFRRSMPDGFSWEVIEVLPGSALRCSLCCLQLLALACTCCTLLTCQTRVEAAALC